MEYQEAIDYLCAGLPMCKEPNKGTTRKKDLKRMLDFCKALGCPHKRYKAIHIAGTNGKGSTSHALAAILQAAGYKVGLYTSPHLYAFTERIRVNGIPISKAYLTAFMNQHKQLFAAIQPSSFEMITAMAYTFFAYRQVDIAVIETGLGGRLDATNIIEPEVTVITNISQDHTARLGNTLTHIAYEKAGIIKAHTPLIVGTYQADIAGLFDQAAKEKKAPLHYATANYSVSLVESSSHALLLDVYRGGRKVFDKLYLGTAGLYQCQNLPAVLYTVDLLTQRGFVIQPQHIRRGLEKISVLTKFRGRWEVLATNPTMVCDAAHNTEGIREAMKQLTTLPYINLHVVFGMSQRPLQETWAMLAELPPDARYYFCKANIPKAMEPHKLALLANSLGLQGKPCHSVAAACKLSQQQAGKNDLIFIAGSNFVAGEALQLKR